MSSSANQNMQSRTVADRYLHSKQVDIKYSEDNDVLTRADSEQAPSGAEQVGDSVEIVTAV